MNVGNERQVFDFGFLMARHAVPGKDPWRDAASVTKINSWLGWQMSLSDRFVSDPPIVGTKNNNVIFSTGINITLAH